MAKTPYVRSSGSCFSSRMPTKYISAASFRCRMLCDAFACSDPLASLFPVRNSRASPSQHITHRSRFQIVTAPCPVTAEGSALTTESLSAMCLQLGMEGNRPVLPKTPTDAGDCKAAPHEVPEVHLSPCGRRSDSCQGHFRRLQLLDEPSA